MSSKTEDRDGCSCGLTTLRSLGQVCNEEAFRYLLDVQRKRSARSDQPFLLLLVDFEAGSGVGTPIDPALARKLFSAMCRALRETDLVGWYHEGCTAGALLANRGEEAWADEKRIVAQRVADALREDLPAPLNRRVRVRVHHLRPNLALSS